MFNQRSQTIEELQQQFVAAAHNVDVIYIKLSADFKICDLNYTAEQFFKITKAAAIDINFFELWLQTGLPWPFSHPTAENNLGLTWNIIECFDSQQQVNGFIIQAFKSHALSPKAKKSTANLSKANQYDSASDFAIENIINHIPSFTLWKDKDGMIIGCNDIGLNILGATAIDEVIGKTEYDFFERAIADEFRKNDQQVFQLGTSIKVEERAYVNSKEVIYLSQKAPLKNNQGQIVGIISSSIDITHCKEHEAALLAELAAREETEREKIRTKLFLQNLISNLPCHVYWKDLNSNYLGCNDLQAKSAGLDTPEQMIGKSDLDMPWKEQAKSLKKIDQTVIKTGIAKVLEEEIVLANNKVMTYLTHKVPLKDEQGITIGLLGISVDITDRKILEAELAKAKEEAETKQKTAEIYLENIMANLPCHVYWKDANGYYLGCNDLQAKSAGFNSADEMIGKSDYEMPWKEQADILWDTDQTIIKTGIPKFLEEPGTYLDGSPATFITSKVPLRDLNNQIIGVLGISIDITERKQAEVALIDAKQKAEIANQAKTDFLANMSHDLRTPLNGILGMTHLLMIKTHYPEQEEFINAIMNASNNLLRLIEDILNFSKLEAGKVEISPEPFDLRKLIEEIGNMMSHQANQKNIQLIIDYSNEIPRHVISDPHCMRRILINLLGNALKFTENGHILIKVKKLKSNHNKARLELIIEDTGIGIPEDKLNTIFDRFSRVEPSYKGRYSGTGLGLTIVKQLVEILGGTITAASKFGKGSRFILKIPFKLQDLTVSSSPWQRHYGDVRILIVDEHPIRSKTILEQLASPNNHITSGDLAINMLISAYKEHKPYQIVIIDDEITYGALKLAQAISEKQEFSQTMLVLFSKPKSFIKSSKAKTAGFFAQVTKPIQPSELISSITKHWTKWLSLRMNQAELLKKYAPAVLLIEDDQIAQRFTSVMLQDLGCSIVDTADTGAKALTIASNNYDIIFLDIGLPDMDGFTIAQTIRQHEDHNNPVPIIALTAHVSEHERELCSIAGMSDFLQKPVSQADLFRALTLWLLNKK